MYRFRRVGYVALNVYDVERTAAFYTEMVGLERMPSNGAQILLRCEADPYTIILHPSDQPGLKRLAFEMASMADLEGVAADLKGKGFAVTPVGDEELATLYQSAAFRMSEPATGATLEFYVRDERCTPPPYASGHTNIQRLGHLVLKTANFDQAIAFFQDVLGFGISDIIEEQAFFFRCTPNPLHHSLAIIRGERNGLHHVNFMVSDIDDIGRATNRFEKNGVPIVAGPGRHPPSDSIFLYYLDPDGMTVEYSFGMEEFPERDPRPPRVLPRTPESFDYWGGGRDPRHGDTGEIERLSPDEAQGAA